MLNLLLITGSIVVVSYVLFLAMVLTGGFAYIQYLFRVGAYATGTGPTPVVSFYVDQSDDGKFVSTIVRITTGGQTKVVPWGGFVKVNGIKLPSEWSPQQANVTYKASIPLAQKYTTEVHYSNNLGDYTETLKANIKK